VKERAIPLKCRGRANAALPNFKVTGEWQESEDGMTAKQIADFQKEQFSLTKKRDPLGFCLAEIALQLALLNEQYARVAHRYEKVTQPVVSLKQ
jgi:hypothetical protein